MKKVIFIFLFLPFSFQVVAQRPFDRTARDRLEFRDMVSVEVVDGDSLLKNVKFEWPLTTGQDSLRNRSDLIRKIYQICSENGVDCPPIRQKVSDNVWRCGNGKRIRIRDNRLANLMLEVWSQR